MAYVRNTTRHCLPDWDYDNRLKLSRKMEQLYESSERAESRGHREWLDKSPE